MPTPTRYQSVALASPVAPGDLAMVKLVPDQALWVRSLVGKICIVIRRLTIEDGVTSSPNIWEVLVDGHKMSLHILDLEPLRPSKDDVQLATG